MNPRHNPLQPSVAVSCCEYPCNPSGCTLMQICHQPFGLAYLLVCHQPFGLVSMRICQQPFGLLYMLVPGQPFGLACTLALAQPFGLGYLTSMSPTLRVGGMSWYWPNPSGWDLLKQYVAKPPNPIGNLVPRLPSATFRLRSLI